MHVRVTTSLLRHHTVITEPMVLYLHNAKSLDLDQVIEKFHRFIDPARLVTSDKLRFLLDGETFQSPKYNPVGYVLSQNQTRVTTIGTLAHRAGLHILRRDDR